MYAGCSLLTTKISVRVTTSTDSGLPTIWPSVTLWSAEEHAAEPKAESTRGSATVLVSSAGAGASSADKGAECVSGKLKAP